MGIFDNPKVRIAIVVIILIVVSGAIILIARNLMKNSPELTCPSGYSPNSDNTMCYENCKSGYKNDLMTGKCILDCPDGKVSSKSLQPDSKGVDKCVVPCGDTGDWCPEDTPCTQYSGGELCMNSNCYNETGNPTYCNTDNSMCGRDSSGSIKNNVPSGTTLDDYGCYKKTTSLTCKPNYSKFTSKENYKGKQFSVCCKYPGDEYPIYEKSGDYEGYVACCPNEKDVLINKLCCPQDNVCSDDKKSYCLSVGEVCTPDGPCNRLYAIGTPGNYTGCCPYPVTNGKCLNVCDYAASNMPKVCTIDEDCVSKDGLTTGLCIKGSCKISCGDMTDSSDNSLVCLNDDSNKVSACKDTKNMCNYDQPNFVNSGPSIDGNTYYCYDNRNKNNFAWKADTPSSYLLEKHAAFSSNPSCTPLSCLEHMATSGLLKTNFSKKTSKDGRQVNIKSKNVEIDTNTDNVCKAIVNCDNMYVTTTDDKEVAWSDQTIPADNMAIKLSNIDGVYDGTWQGNGRCNVGINPDKCLFLEDGTYAKYGTMDGTSNTLIEKYMVTGQSCQPAAAPDSTQTGSQNTLKKATYDNSVNCKVISKIANNKTVLTPVYYCPTRGGCCGPAAIPGSSYSTHTNCYAFKIGEKLTNNKYIWSTVSGRNTTNPDGNSISFDRTEFNDISELSTPVADKDYKNIDKLNILDLTNVLSKSSELFKWYNDGTHTNNYNCKYANAIIIMQDTSTKKYLNFSNNNILSLTNDTNEKINFYYNFNRVESKVSIHYQISILNGILRWGRTSDFVHSDNVANIGRPVLCNNNDGDYTAVLDNTFIETKPMNDNNRIITIINIDNEYYLASINAHWTKVRRALTPVYELKIDENVYLASKSLKDGTEIQFYDLAKYDSTTKKWSAPSTAMTLDLVCLTDSVTDNSMINNIKIKNLLDKITGVNSKSDTDYNNNLPTIADVINNLKQSRNLF